MKIRPNVRLYSIYFTPFWLKIRKGILQRDPYSNSLERLKQYMTALIYLLLAILSLK